MAHSRNIRNRCSFKTPAFLRAEQVGHRPEVTRTNQERVSHVTRPMASPRGSQIF